MKIVCILQNAWGYGGSRLPMIFAPNPLNKSAKVIKKICGTNKFYFANTTAEVTSHARIGAPTNPRHFKQLVKRLRSFDLIMVCGRQAEAAVKDHLDYFIALKKPVLYVPHPASRTLKNTHLTYIKSILDNINPLNEFIEYDLIAG